MTPCVNLSHIFMTSLNQNELEALRILWERGELKPAEIQAHFSWPIENATLRSVLVNLVEKKHITRRLQGKAFFYAAAVPKATLFAVFSGVTKGLSAQKLAPFIDNMHTALWVIAATSLIGTVVCLARPRHVHAPATQEGARESDDHAQAPSPAEGVPVGGLAA